MTPRARYVGEKAGRGRLEEGGAVKGQKGQRKDKPKCPRGKRQQKKRAESQGQRAPTKGVLVSAHNRFPVGRGLR